MNSLFGHFISIKRVNVWLLFYLLHQFRRHQLFKRWIYLQYYSHKLIVEMFECFEKNYGKKLNWSIGFKFRLTVHRFRLKKKSVYTSVDSQDWKKYISRRNKLNCVTINHNKIPMESNDAEICFSFALFSVWFVCWIEFCCALYVFD